ncbi:MAG: Xaa-Pro aminopeptidase [Bermanella sp.]
MAVNTLEFTHNRQTLLSNMVMDSVAIIPAASLKVRNRDAEFPFRQHSDFFYLSGFREDNAVLVLRKTAQKSESLLFCQSKDKDMEIWTGFRLGPDAALDALQLQGAFPIQELAQKLPGLLADIQCVYALWGSDREWDQKFIHAIEQIKLKVRTGITAPTSMLALEPLLHEQRLIKSSAEIALMTQAAQISAEAHIKAMKMVVPGMYEYMLEGEIRHHCAMQGSRFDAYSSIVGSGENACILHYTDNDAQIDDGDLILIDAGCEVNHYASDITRTFPANGKFSPEQKALYQVVLDAQLAAIAQIKAGNHFNAPHEAALQVITQGLVDLGLLVGEVNELIEQEAYKPFYMHKTGHWLGLDVHDVGAYKVEGEWRTLQAGMVLTAEPGLYVAADEASVDKKWRGIGIRIEDDVLVTATGCEVLSKDVPKSIDAIEALMARH